MAQRNKKRRLDRKQAAVTEEAQRRTIRSVVRSERFRFVVAFALSCIALYAIIQVLPPSFTRPINEHTAMTLGMALNASGITVSTEGDIVSGGGLAFKIILECTALFTTGLFSCFVIFHPATIRQKATGLAMGIPALYLCNLFRLAATFMISRRDWSFFEVVHVYLGQVFTIFLVIVVCIAWVKWVEHKETKQGMLLKVAAFLARFILISGCLFLVWTKMNHWYVWLLDRFMIFGFSLFYYRVELARHAVFYYETFSIVVFVSLVLSVRSLPRPAKIRGLAAGLGFLFFIHLFHRIDNAFIAYFNFTSALPIDLTLLLIGQYLVPVLFLILLIYRQKERKSPL